MTTQKAAEERFSTMHLSGVWNLVRNSVTSHEWITISQKKTKETFPVPCFPVPSLLSDDERKFFFHIHYLRSWLQGKYWARCIKGETKFSPSPVSDWKLPDSGRSKKIVSGRFGLRIHYWHHFTLLTAWKENFLPNIGSRESDMWEFVQCFSDRVFWVAQSNSRSLHFHLDWWEVFFFSLFVLGY